MQNKIFFEPSLRWQVILLANLPPWCENHLLEWWVFERSLCITTRRICRKGGRKAKFASYSKHCMSCNKHYMFGIQKLMFICPIMVWGKELQMATFITFMKVIKVFFMVLYICQWYLFHKQPWHQNPMDQDWNQEKVWNGRLGFVNSFTMVGIFLST
jgi:hypothetical protein